jgi:hypothetical protein
MALPLSLRSSIADASAFGVLDGRISLTVFNGTSPYRFAWSSGESTSAITTGAGIYTVIVTDANMLSITASFTIHQPIVFNIDTSIPDVGLLNDTICRKLTCGTIVSNNSKIIGRSAAETNFLLYNSSTTYNSSADISSQLEQDGKGSVLVSPYDTAAVRHNTLKVTCDGVFIDGNLEVTGQTNEVTVNDIIVNDKTITLSNTSTTLAGLNGSGINFGPSSLSRNMLYNSATDALVWNGASLTANKFLSGPNSFTPTSSVLSSAYGSLALDTTSFTITNPTIVNAQYSTSHVVSNAGLLYKATGDTFGFNSNQWLSTLPINADSFVVGTGGPVLSSTGISFTIPDTANQVTIGESSGGISVANTTLITSEGIDLNNAILYFGNRSWRIIYDDVEDSLVFEKYDTLSGNFISKLVLD